MSKRERDETKDFQDKVVAALKEIARYADEPYNYTPELKDMVDAIGRIDATGIDYSNELSALAKAVNTVAFGLSDINDTLKDIGKWIKHPRPDEEEDE